MIICIVHLNDVATGKLNDQTKLGHLLQTIGVNVVEWFIVDHTCYQRPYVPHQMAPVGIKPRTLGFLGEATLDHRCG